jgi:hypothetical protein
VKRNVKKRHFVRRNERRKRRNAVDPKREEQDRHQQVLAAVVREVEAVEVTVPPRRQGPHHQGRDPIHQIQDHILLVPRTVPELLHRRIPVAPLVVQEAVVGLPEEKAKDPDRTVKAQGQAGHHHIRVVKVEEERIARIESRMESFQRTTTRKSVHPRL